jgi:response regulator RpfG family c-di-GMP phosphodiesterase
MTEPSIESVWASVRMAMAAERITETNRKSIESYLTILSQRDEKTFRHVVRVGLKCRIAARYVDTPGITPKMMLWAGLLHDVGKTLIDRNVLQKTSGFTEQDMAAMEPHVRLGWQLLERVHDFSAHIIVRHHQYGKMPYPKELPQLPGYLTPKEPLVEAAARLLSLVDYYDAITTRNNDKFVDDGKRERFITDNHHHAELITKLEESGVFKFDA